jgi:hypothetical protein
MTGQLTPTDSDRRCPRWFEPRGPSLIVLALVAANLVYRLVAYRPGYFWQDDYYITAWAKFNPLGPDYLLLRFSDHFQPLGLAAAWVSQRLFPGSYSAAMTWTAILYAASIWVMYRLLLSIFGWRPQMLLVLLIWGFSVFTLQGYLWYAASIYLAPFLLLLPLALLMAVRYVAQPTVGRLIAAFAASALVVAAHTFGGSLVALTALLLAVGAVGSNHVGPWWRRVLVQWRLLLAQAVPSVVVLMFYVSRSADGKGVTIEPLQTLSYVWRQFTWVIIPGLAGGPWKYNTFLGPEFPFFTPLAGFVILEFLVLLGLLAWVRPRAFWFWMGALLLVGGQLAAVTLGRGGGDTATILRYSTPGLVALTLAISMTLMSPRGGTFAWRHGGQRLAEAWRGWDPVGRLIVIALVMQAFLVSFSISALTPIFESPFGFNRAYMANMQQSIQRIPVGVSLIPQFAPNSVVPVAAPGPTSTELVLASLPETPDFANSVSGDLWGFTEQGRLVKQAVFGVEASRRAGNDCAALLTGKPQTLSLKRDAEFPYATLSLGSIAEGPIQVRVEIMDRGQATGAAEVTVASGLQRTYAYLPGRGDSLRLTPQASQPLCITDAIVGERYHWDEGWVQDGSSLPTQSFDLSTP